MNSVTVRTRLFVMLGFLMYRYQRVFIIYYSIGFVCNAILFYFITQKILLYVITHQ